MGFRIDRRDDAHRAKRRPHWPELARCWRWLGPPLRPCAEDLAIYADRLDEWRRRHGSPRVLILGVTPELYELSRTRAASIVAVDRTQAMIDEIWPGPIGSAIRGEWTSLPLASDSVDIAFCDAGTVQLRFPKDVAELARSLHRVLGPNGVFVCRLCASPVAAEGMKTVLADLDAGAIRSVNHLKLRLGMALQSDSRDGVQLGHIWQTLTDNTPNLADVAVRSSWPVESLCTLEPYHNSTVRYHFASVDEVRDVFENSPGGFTLDSLHSPNYELGACCPLISFHRGKARKM